ncbi:metallophosphoesterase [Abyssalbus ytuae]|uniref:Metallophosphoesterase n=1 Tax=Abyssalbus ytuae TaxID=2926907 RepID=A0A9E6ZKL6_9FLAO|nr:BamA/TamA family outer membrane protein [Abyssalbus ytuae]UOB16309.1 metallophosphoesterase [Abyssalbus ytuae]
MKVKYLTLNILVLTLLTACATYKPQYQSDKPFQPYPEDKEIDKTFYLIGDAGYSELGSTSLGLIGFKQAIDTVRKGDYAIFLGDNIYPAGMPKKGHPDRQVSEHRLNTQLYTVSDFKGETIFIPGNHDWYNEGIKGLNREENYFEDRLKDKKIFYPSDACGLDEIEVSDSVHLIIVDSQWYIEDWDNHPGINDNCEIKTREKFFIELEGMIKKNEGKTIILAVHHPLFTYGPHGGYFSARQQLYPSQKKIPVPVLGMLANHIRKSGGISIQDLLNERYNKFSKRIQSLIKDEGKIIVVSGHEHSLQYIVSNNIHQIISGAGSKSSETKLSGDAVFTYGKQGFAIVDVFKDGSSWVRYYVNKSGKNELAFQTEIYPPDTEYIPKEYSDDFPQYVEASVYDEEKTERSGFYEGFWGDHYREAYGIKVKAKVALLDTLYGGLEPIRMGGGHQSKTLRLVDKQGREFNMRALEKSAVKFLQSVVFKGKVMDKEDLTGTLPERFLLDFYTAAHPYTPYAIDELSDAVGVYHTNPKLYYIPKQTALGEYNEEYGDELYMIEERPADEHKNVKSFGYASEIESTDDLFANLREDEKYKLDEASYIRARLFDMLIGDWDRHSDQWRWAEFDKGKNKIYRPIPRDRDQAFSNFDGAFLGSLRVLMSPVKMMQTYDEELNNLEYFNTEPLPMDRILLQNSTREDWLREAEYIMNHLTNEAIEKGFNNLPPEVQGESVELIKEKLKGRRTNLKDIANEYFEIVNEIGILKGTDKDDIIEVTRTANKETNVKIYRNKDGEKADLMVDKTFNKDITREIWVYGLDDDDIFIVNGKANNPVLVRLIGGQNNDIYKINNGRKVVIYDHKSKPNTIEVNRGARERLTDIYENNIFTFDKNVSKSTTIFPSVGYNPDDGIKVGVKAEIHKYGFERDPYTTRKTLTANYFFATEGFEFIYDAELASILGKANLIYGAKATSANFTMNFFGLGNETLNLDDDRGLDYNRVKMSQLMAYLGMVKRSEYGSDFVSKLKFEGIEVDNTRGRYITQSVLDDNFFERKYFGTAELQYTYESYDEKLNPTKGMLFNVTTGYTVNFSDADKSFGYLNPQLGFYNRLTKNDKLVLKTRAASQLRIGNDFEFYQGAYLGGNSGLRGYRLHRFIGENSLVFNGDLRFNFKSFKTSFLPMQLGIYSGYDYGRVWIDNENSNKWHDSVGGGLYLVASKLINADFSFFNSDEGNRFAFKIGVSF